jgi:hypothetical protein
MAIHYIDLDKDYINRFDLAKFIKYDNDSFDILTSYFIRELKKLPSKGNLTVTYQEFKPELLADIIYGDTQYEWVLMEYNNLTDIFDIVSGTVINYPSLTDLEALYFGLISKQTNAIKQVTNNVNQLISLDGNFSNVSNSNTGSSTTTTDSHFVYDFTNTDNIIVDHTLGKRPAVQVFEFDNANNEINLECSFSYPLGFETTRVIVNLSENKTGKVVLN